MKYDKILKIKNCVLVYTGVILFVLPVLSTESIIYQTCKKKLHGRHGGLSGRASDSRARSRGSKNHHQSQHSPNSHALFATDSLELKLAYTAINEHTNTHKRLIFRN